MLFVFYTEIHTFPQQICEWYNIQEVEPLPPYHVHLLPTSQSADHRSRGQQLLLPLWPQVVLHGQGSQYGHPRWTQVWASSQGQRYGVSRQQFLKIVCFFVTRVSGPNKFLAAQLYQILIPTTFNRLMCHKCISLFKHFSDNSLLWKDLVITHKKS